MAALPGTDKRLTGGGRDFTVWSWFDAADAPSAIDAAGILVRAAAVDVGIGPLKVIRAHAASVEGRSSPFRGIAERLGRRDQWTVYFKVVSPLDAAPADDGALERVAAALDRPDTAVTFGGDREKFLLDDGHGIVVRFWVEGPDPSKAFAEARDDMVQALARSGLGDWTIVRMQAATAEARHGDWFPGAAKRQPLVTEETR